MSFRGRVARLLRVVRGDGSTAVDVGTFQPHQASATYAAAVTLWDKLGDQFAAFAFEDVGTGGNPVAYLGVGKKANAWTPTLKLYNNTGVSLLGNGSGVGLPFLDFTDLDPNSAQPNGATIVRFNDVQTGALRAAPGGPLTLDGGKDANGNPQPVSAPNGIAGPGPLGIIAKNINTTPSGGITTAAAAVLSCPAAYKAGRQYRVEAFIPVRSTASGDTVACELTINGAVAQVGQEVAVTTANSGYSLYVSTLYTPSVSGTYTTQALIWRTNGTGTISAAAGNGQNFYLAVEDLGAA